MRKAVVVLLMSAFFGAGVPAFAAGGNDYRESSWLNPRAPQVGQTYSLYIKAENTSPWPILFRASLDQVPQGDQPLGAREQQQVVGPGQSFTFRFAIDCGVQGGTVYHSLRADWAVPPTNGGDFQTSSTWLNPRDPLVGETYSVYRRVRNTGDYPIRFRARLGEVPNGDRPLGATVQEQLVQPGESVTFRFDIYCGVPGGRVSNIVDAFWPAPPRRGPLPNRGDPIPVRMPKKI